MKRKPAVITYLVLLVTVLVADLWSKEVVFERLKVEIGTNADGRPMVIDHAPAIDIVPNYFQFEAVLNLGAFSGWFHELPWLLVAVSAIAIIVTTGIVVVPAQSSRLIVIALALVASGAIGNLYDRLKVGAVRDFIKWFYVDSSGKAHVWPNFNIADSAIVAGVCLIILREFLAFRSERKAKASEQATA